MVLIYQDYTSQSIGAVVVVVVIAIIAIVIARTITVSLHCLVVACINYCTMQWDENEIILHGSLLHSTIELHVIVGPSRSTTELERTIRMVIYLTSYNTTLTLGLHSYKEYF